MLNSFFSYNTPDNLQVCKVIVEEASRLLYYSHIPTAAIALLIGFFVLYKNKANLLSKILFSITLMFAIWTGLDLIVWIRYDNSSLVTFAWSFFGIVHTLIYLLSFYFVAVFINGKDISIGKKVLASAFALPVLLLIPTAFNLTGFSDPDCAAMEGQLYTNYYYILSLVIAIAIIIYSVYFARKADKEVKRQVALLVTGIECFLIIFFIAVVGVSYLVETGYIANGDYSLEQYGLFSMPIFMAFLGYLIVRFKAFNIKLLGTQALVVAIMFLVGSEFFFVTSTLNRTLVAITFVLISIAGYSLIQSVKREIEAREKLAIANVHLEELNRQKSEFVSFASHQLRSPLTSIKGNASLILEGDAGPVSPMVKQLVETMLEATKTQINVVESYLNSSRIELGTMKYSLIDMDFKELTDQVMSEQKPNIEAKGLTHTLTIDRAKTYKIKADPDKFKQVLMNIVDNSLKYTIKGSVNVSLVKDEAKGTITFKVWDTGVGIRPDVMPKLFRKFSRAENANEANIHGTGLGLFIAKDIVEAHNGRIWAESEGEGKGAQFYVEVPEAK